MMRGLEGALEAMGLPLVAGVDEAGRGALAGPVVVAAVVPDPRRLVPGVDDSKALPAARREALAELIRAHSIATAVVAIDAARIDAGNILRATREAMVQALLELRPVPSVAVVDAVALPALPFPSLSLVKGDRISYAIAAASILAKVERDRTMRAHDREWPWYGFAEHKGYGAPRHLAALVAHGPSPLHRLTFRGVLPRRGDLARRLA